MEKFSSTDVSSIFEQAENILNSSSLMIELQNLRTTLPAETESNTVSEEIMILLMKIKFLHSINKMVVQQQQYFS
jgi:hypothetical protein